MTKLIPSNTKRDDCVQTPLNYARIIVNHFTPDGKVLEPCKGDGNFLTALKEWELNEDKPEWLDIDSIEWCEILEGKDFMDYKGKVDWIITNPPYSKMRKFIQKSMEVSDNIVFLTSINHLWLKARLRDVFGERFGIKEIVIFDTPKNFPQSGFQFGCFHLCRDYAGDIKFNVLNIEG